MAVAASRRAAICQHPEDGGSKVHWREVFNGPKGVVFRAHLRTPSQGREESTELKILGLGSGKPTSPMLIVPMKGLYWPGSAAMWRADLAMRLLDMFVRRRGLSVSAKLTMYEIR